VNIGETTCKNIINKSGISGVDYAVNPYIGCSHGCRYCYARFMTRWYHKGEKWGTFVDVKKNALDCIKEEAPRKKLGTILFSSVTDPYQPVEKKYRITRSLLECLLDFDFPVEILTKSSLVIRDLDLISELTHSEVGLTITCYDEAVRKAFEPRASSVIDRLTALEKFSEIGVPTFVFLGPLLPFLSEDGIDELLNSIASKVGRVIVDRLNIKAGNWRSIEETLYSFYPAVITEFKEASRDNSEYYNNLRNRVIRSLEVREIPYEIIF
jgi:DNA repair photolyase